MNPNIFEQCGTTYEDVLSLVSSVAIQCMRKYHVEDMKEELVSQGMITVLECLRNFDPTRHAKATTYVYKYVFGRLNRLAQMQRKYRNARLSFEDARECIAMDPSKDSPIYAEPNPYSMRPDTMYDKTRFHKFAQKVFEYHDADVEQYKRAYKPHADSRSRQIATRLRQKSVTRISKTVRSVLRLNCPLSTVSQILANFSTSASQVIENPEEKSNH